MEIRLPFPLCSEDFKWEKRISQGAFINVFVVKHQASGEDFPYVCKVIRKQDAAERKQIGRILYERKLTMSTLRKNPHPYIMRHFGAFHDEHCLYFLSEFMSGGDVLRSVRPKRYAVMISFVVWIGNNLRKKSWEAWTVELFLLFQAQTIHLNSRIWMRKTLTSSYVDHCSIRFTASSGTYRSKIKLLYLSCLFNIRISSNIVSLSRLNSSCKSLISDFCC